MNKKDVAFHLQNLADRVVLQGGFSEQSGSVYRSDATAWAIMALDANGAHTNLINPARSRLAAEQRLDGMIALSNDHPDSYWPTSLAILAWYNSIKYSESMQRAASFLLQKSGMALESKSYPIFGHDPSIPGWSWNVHSFSWVEPTALAIIALESAGYIDHPRVQDGVRLLMDRQLPGGGWNYGNTVVYDQELLPQPDNTGIALTALVSKVDRRDIEISLDYLHNRVVSLRSPRSLSWALLGLGSWGQRPSKSKEWILKSLSLQDRYGAYDTTLLSQLCLAFIAQNGTIPFLLPRNNIDEAS